MCACVHDCRGVREEGGREGGRKGEGGTHGGMVRECKGFKEVEGNLKEGKGREEIEKKRDRKGRKRKNGMGMSLERVGGKEKKIERKLKKKEGKEGGRIRER